MTLETEADSMAVIEMAETGGPEVLVPGRRPRPEPRPGEVLLRVIAAGVPVVGRAPWQDERCETERGESESKSKGQYT